MSALAASRAPTVRYAAAVFLGSSLLFLLEPIAGKRVLPLLGGSAAVWTACLVFFQLALLLGYFAAHWLVTATSTRVQVRVYVALLVLSVVQVLGTRTLDIQADSSHPIRSVLSLLTLLIGVPFVTLSMSGPLLQGWYARATSGGVSQPYRLYVVSNIGSLLALVAYPWLLEPRWSLHDQTTILFAGLILLVALCATIALQFQHATSGGTTPESRARVAADTSPITIGHRALWISLAMCASLLLSAVTNYISQNIATLPLMWVIPLIAYLLSFVVAFADDRWRPRWLELGLVAGALGLMSYRLFKGDLFVSIPKLVAIYCGSLFLICLYCHAELYRRRPAASRLTEFYFFLAAGGAIGAIIVGIMGPLLLDGNYELVLGLTLAGFLVLLTTWARSGWMERTAWAVATVALAVLAHRFIRNDAAGSSVHLRNFYGTLRVADAKSSDLNAVVRTLYNGVIEHGQEVFREDLADTPTTYYGPSSGVGLSINLCCPGRARRIGVIGLGTGTLASYGKPGDVIRFYDINPAVEGVARGSFTYVRDSKAKVDVVIGDARVSLAAEPAQQYDVLAIDAFAGDAIPVHLITSEALRVYRRHLAPGGVVAFHVSNRHLNLAPVVKQLADHENMKAALIANGDDAARGISSSDWVLVTTNESLASTLEYSKDREAIKVAPGLRRWTDDYNSLLPILRAFHPK